jgi:hypothetical protein
MCKNWYSHLDSARLAATVTAEDANGDEIEFTVPIRFSVCERCDGRGRHVDSRIDGNGLTAEDFEDADFAENYFGGVYDVQCEECRGARVVAVFDAETATPAMRQAMDDHFANLSQAAAWDAEDAHTRRMEAGGY